MEPGAVKLLLLARLVAYMALVYVLFGMIVEWLSRRPNSKLRAFARLICSPLTALVAKFQPPDTPYRTLLLRTGLAVATLWVVLLIATEIAAKG